MLSNNPRIELFLGLFEIRRSRLYLPVGKSEFMDLYRILRCIGGAHSSPSAHEVFDQVSSHSEKWILYLFNRISRSTRIRHVQHMSDFLGKICSSSFDLVHLQFTFPLFGNLPMPLCGFVPNSHPWIRWRWLQKTKYPLLKISHDPFL